MQKKCQDCKFFEYDKKNTKQGYCHYNPPTVNLTNTAMGTPLVRSDFSPTQEENWCGRFETCIRVVQ